MLDFNAENWATLQDEHRRLAHAAELIQGAQQVVAVLEDEAQGAVAQIQAARNRLADLVEIDEALKSALEMLDSSLIQAEEARITSYNVCYTKLLRMQGGKTRSSKRIFTIPLFSGHRELMPPYIRCT